MTTSGDSAASPLSSPATAPGTAVGVGARDRRPGPLTGPAGARGGRRLAVAQQGQQQVGRRPRGASGRWAEPAGQPAQPLLDHGTAAAVVPLSTGRPIAARTRSASGASRRRSPNAAQRTDSTRAPVRAANRPALTS